MKKTIIIISVIALCAVAVLFVAFGRGKNDEPQNTPDNIFGETLTTHDSEVMTDVPGEIITYNISDEEHERQLIEAIHYYLMGDVTSDVITEVPTVSYEENTEPAVDYDVPSVDKTDMVINIHLTDLTYDKIMKIKSSYQSYFVSFDDSECYYMCAYFNPSHTRSEYGIYCCFDKYTWIRVDDALQIEETYNGEKFVAAFQVNSASFTQSMKKSESFLPSIESIDYYRTHFVSGVNQAGTQTVSGNYMYLRSSLDYYVFFGINRPHQDFIKLSFMEYREQIHIMVQTDYIQSNGEHIHEDLERNLGYYLSDVENLMLPEKYSEVENNVVKYYGLIPADAFSEFIDRIRVDEYIDMTSPTE